jgi:multidrug efflux pump subunit AcrA (membrane-fusion protein)
MKKTNKDEFRKIALLNARWLLLSALALPLALLPGCKKEAAPETQVTVQAGHPEQGAIAEHITADAILAPLAQAAIAPRISAPVRKFYVQRGSKVKQGQLLATLENSDLAAAAMDNKGAYMTAQAAYATETRAQVPEDMLKATSDVAQAKANLDLNLSIVKGRKQLFAEGAIPGRDLDTARRLNIFSPCAASAARPRSSRHRGSSPRQKAS